MKPLNLDNSPCSPISSNCVIWQGPDIPCIKLCAGDTVSDVVFKLATELCAIMETLDVTNYDLSCFNLVACGPNDFQALIQFLIEQICSLQTEVTTVLDPATSPIVNQTKSSSADTLVTVAPCFVIGTTTVMTVSEYAQAIGTRVCSIVDQITIINAQIINLEVRVTNIENTPVPTPVTPSFTLSCQIGSLPSGSTNFINTILQQFINNVWCSYTTATGSTSDILSAVGAICITDTDLQLTTGAAFSINPFWIQNSSYSTLSDAVNNLWVALCDVYQYSNSLAITVADTSTVDLNMTSNVITAKIPDTGWVDLNGFSFYSGVDKPKCRRIGNVVHFKGNVFVPLENPSSPGNVVPLTSTGAYNSVANNKPWTGTGGCTIDANGAILFNNGASVVPASITTGNFDDAYSLGWIVATRGVDINASFGTSLTGMFAISISAAKGLQASMVHDLEITTTRGSGVQGNSALRFVTSNVRIGEYLPNYIALASDIHNAPTNANFPLVSDTFNLTWPFSCDAGNENNVGGFNFKLDGLVAYLAPCNIETGLSVVCP